MLFRQLCEAVLPDHHAWANRNAELREKDYEIIRQKVEVKVKSIFT